MMFLPPRKTVQNQTVNLSERNPVNLAERRRAILILAREKVSFCA
jgi:hypothetical protein